jgi:hypothetical protein
MLIDYINDNGITVPSFAKTIDVKTESVRRYIKEGRVPEPKIMRRIMDATNNQVMPNDFFIGA